jgi:DEAD/DEAH box helicase domain-containing protein
MKTIKADLSNEGRLDILERVKAYRGGKKILIISCHRYSNHIRIYSRGSRFSLKYFDLDLWIKQDRRKIEHEAFSGQLLGIIATNALELGIDIGVLDAVIMLGFPMTISNFVGLDFVQILFGLF